MRRSTAEEKKKERRSIDVGLFLLLSLSLSSYRMLALTVHLSSSPPRPPPPRNLLSIPPIEKERGERIRGEEEFGRFDVDVDVKDGSEQRDKESADAIKALVVGLLFLEVLWWRLATRSGTAASAPLMRRTGRERE